MRQGFIRFYLVLVLTGVAGLIAGCDKDTRDTDIKFISVSEAKHLFDRVQKGETGAAVFLDPRPARQFAEGHIPGAKNITLANVKPTDKTDPRISKYSNLVVYGDNPASATARGLTKRLLAVGYRDVRFYADGLELWAGRGYPVERDPAPPDSAPGTP